MSACTCPCPACGPVQPSVGWGPKTDGEFLRWLAERLVNVYGESPNVDFLYRLEHIADTLEDR